MPDENATRPILNWNDLWRPDVPTETTVSVSDRLEIHDLLHRYALMVDRREWKRMDTVFAPDATIDYRTSGGIEGPHREVLGWLDRALEPWPLNLHFISNIVLDLDGDRGRSTCYFHAPMGRPGAEGMQEIITNLGYYEDDLIRTEHGWRIQHRNCQQTMMLGSLPEEYEIPS